MGGASGVPPAQAARGASPGPCPFPCRIPQAPGARQEEAGAETADVQGQVRGGIRPPSLGIVLTPRRVVGVSAQDAVAALSITFWALLHSVPTSWAIMIAAAP